MDKAEKEIKRGKEGIKEERDVSSALACAVGELVRYANFALPHY